MGAKDFEEAAAVGKEELEQAGFVGGETTGSDTLDLRQEVFDQIHLLKSIRGHLFAIDGSPKIATDFKDIRAYLTSSSQLLHMLQKFEEALNTDADFARIELAIERAMEDCACPEFVQLLKQYLTENVEQEMEDEVVHG